MLGGSCARFRHLTGDGFLRRRKYLSCHPPLGNTTNKRKVLHSWKDISNYAGRGIRTIQRYEVQFGFPVHRPAGKRRSSVLAFSNEVDAWLNRPPKRERLDENSRNNLTLEQRRRYLAVIAEARRSREMATATFDSCVRQAKRVQEMVQKFNAMAQKMHRGRQSA